MKILTPILLILIVLVNTTTGKALSLKQANDSSTMYTIGDQFPDVSFQLISENQKKIINLSDLSGKLIILDFWNTSCGSCIMNMPKM